MSMPFIGEIVLFAGNFAPRGWAYCDGRLIGIQQNTALFSILGTTYGGDGVTNFALPDLRGRVPVGAGQGPGIPVMGLGQVGGEATHTLNTTEIPAHVHAVQASLTANATTGTSSAPATSYIAQTVLDPSTRPPTLANAFTPGTPSNPVALAGLAVAVGPTGGNQAHNNMQPYTGLNYIIAVEGVYPSRN